MAPRPKPKRQSRLARIVAGKAKPNPGKGGKGAGTSRRGGGGQ